MERNTREGKNTREIERKRLSKFKKIKIRKRIFVMNNGYAYGKGSKKERNPNKKIKM